MKFDRRHLVRLGAVLAIIGGVLFAQAQLASAGGDGEEKETKSECSQAKSFESVFWTVDGEKVTSLEGNVHPGSEVRVAYKLKPGCEDTPVSLKSYESEDEKSSKYKMSDSDDTAAHSSGGTKYLAVTVPQCRFQLDLSTEKGGHSKGSAESTKGGSRCGEKGEKPSGHEKPEQKPVEAKPSETKPVKAAAACVTEANKRVSNVTYEVNGKSVKTLDGNVNSGDAVKAHFEVASGCQQRVSLAAYEAKSASKTEEAVSQQKLSDSDTGMFSGGKHSLEVKAPDCCFQIDLVNGAVIQKLGPAGSGNFYSAKGQLIAAATNAEGCEAPAEVKNVVATKPEVKTTVNVRAVTPAAAPATTTTTTAVPKPAEVQSAVEERPELAKSGLTTLPLTAGAGVMVLSGSAMMLAGTLRRKKK